MDKGTPPADAGGVKVRRLEGESGADAIRVRRMGVARRIAVAVDIEEAVGVARTRRALPPIVANLQAIVTRIIVRHLSLERLVLGALVRSPGIAGCPVGGGDDLGVAEQEQFVGGRGDRGVLVRAAAADVVRELPDGLHLGLEIGGHEVPNLTRIHLRTELRLLPSAGIRIRGVHAGPDARRGREEREPRLTRSVRKVIVVNTDDAASRRRIGSLGCGRGQRLDSRDG